MKKDDLRMVHLHTHSTYSLLDGFSSVDDIVNKAVEYGSPAAAITDHGNMYGAFELYSKCKEKGIKPIIGCELYLVEDRHKKKFTREEQDERYHLLALAINKTGYKNLMKICSAGFIEGYYAGYPRIDKEILLKYREGIILTSSCANGEIPQHILHDREDLAIKKVKWYLDNFGENFYIELQHHGINDLDDTGKSQIFLNSRLIDIAKRFNIPMIITNDTHYTKREDSEYHDIMLCINTGSKLSDPKGRGKGMRFGFPNDQFYIKTPKEILMAFEGIMEEHEIIECMENTLRIADMVEDYDLESPPILPRINWDGGTEEEYFEHLVMEGAKKNYGKLTQEILDRINYEISVIKEKGFVSYFLIVHDIIKWARDNGIWVGPGRGSAAGSIVSYCLGITKVDPLKYGLLFERFLNPGRTSLPDIDTDFEDEARDKVIEYIANKYGRENVAQIITFQRLQSRGAFKDVARVMDIPFTASNIVSKNILSASIESEKEVVSMVDALDFEPQVKKKIKEALRISKYFDGVPKSAGKHAAGIVIAPGKIDDYIPVCIVKDSPLPVSQYEMEWVEKAGLVKIDILGLTTLTILKETVRLIKEIKGITIDIDQIPLDDKETYELFHRGDLLGIFQFESEGMRKYMRKLKPNCIEDLMAMNALYRPGPMKYIDTYIERKHDPSKRKGEHPILDEILKETYGILVYQEQVIEVAKRMAGYTPAEADDLRKVIAKKKVSEIPYHEKKFIEGCVANGISEEFATKLFERIKEFGDYGFNKSHAACYAILGYQTAYMKTHYPAFYMSALLSAHINNRDKLHEYIEEARRMKLEIKPPYINTAHELFYPIDDNTIAFGFSGIKDIGENLAKRICEEREKNGKFIDILDFIRRMRGKGLTRKSMEALAFSGSFDEIFPNREYFLGTYPNKSEDYIDALMSASSFGSSGTLLGFIETSQESMMPPPPPIPNNPSSKIKLLAKEREYTGFFLTQHPFEFYMPLIRNWRTLFIKDINEFQMGAKQIQGQQWICAFVSEYVNAGKYHKISCEDETSSTQFLFDPASTLVRQPIKEGDIVMIKILPEKGYKVTIKDIIPLDDINIPFIVNISIPSDEEIIGKLLSCCDEEPSIHGILTIRFKDRKRNIYHTFSSEQKIKISLAFLNLIYKASMKNGNVNEISINVIPAFLRHIIQ